MRFTKPALTTLAGVVALAISAPLSAHAELVRSTPAARASVAAPRTISLTFSERLVPAFSTMELVMAGHDDMKLAVTTSVSQDGKTLVGTPRTPLASGAYTVRWTAATTDGHRISGTVPFRVR